MAHYDIFNLTESDIIEMFGKIIKANTGFLPKDVHLVTPNNVADESNDLIITFYRNGLGATFVDTVGVTYGVNIDLGINGRACLVRFKVALGIDGDTTDYYIMFSNTKRAITYTRSYNGSIPTNGLRTNYSNNVGETPTGYSTLTGRTTSCTGSYTGTIADNRNYDGQAPTLARMDSEQTGYFNTIIQHSSNYTYDWNTETTRVSGYAIGNFMPVKTYQTYYDRWNGTGGVPIFKKIASKIPVFDSSKYINVINYLDTGDRTGEFDPFDPNTPSATKVSDFTTNFVMNISANTPTSSKISVTSRNADYLAGGYDIVGDYSTYLAKNDEVFSTFNFNNPNYVQKQSQGAMTITYDLDINSIRESGFNCVSQFVFGDNDVFSGEGGTYNFDSKHSGVFKVTLIPNSGSKVNLKLGNVWYAEYPSGTDTPLSREVYGDGYKFTAPSGDTLVVLFRSISLDDLKNIIDDGYPYIDDDENPASGDDNIALFGSGLRTYNISDNAFEEVNKTLWTTNWNEVFKSNTIDPIKSVISCKRIPFTISGTPTDTLYLANRRIDIGQGFYINPIKSYNVANYTIEALYGNFVDIKYTKVKVWLPYIGWKELPASEVISRVSRPQVGLISSIKTLNFKYIVDFVDGNCRCVISVNGTERWCFDGNCGIDVPVTSDNHTQAINTATRSGVSAGLKIFGGIVGTAVGMGMAGAFGGVAGGLSTAGAIASGLSSTASGVMDSYNTNPTYEYSTSCSPSGYIEGAMNKHIMIVIEYPNAFYPTYYEHKFGKPCYLNLALGSCSGFTKTVNVDCSNIPCTSDEQNMIKQLLDAGVYF